MTPNQRIIIYALFLLNIAVYGVIGMGVFVIAPAQRRVNAQWTAIALEQAQSTDAPEATPTDTPTPTIIPSPTSTLTLSPTPSLSKVSEVQSYAPTPRPASHLVAAPATSAAPTPASHTVAAPAMSAAPTPRGDRPETARVPMYVRPEYCIEEMCPGAILAPTLTSQGTWAWIDANSTTWYKLDDGHSLQVKLWLFANGQSGLAFDVYAPGQRDLDGKPIGRGTKDRFQPGDLFYSGRTQAGGIWYVKVINSNPYSIWYSLRFTRTIPYMANTCDSCHKPMGSLMFDQCTNGAGSTWCQDLEWLYNQNPTTFDHSIPGK